MSWRPGAPTFDEWAQLLGSCERSAVHLEMRDGYAVAAENPMLAAWRAGHRYDLSDEGSWWRPWLSLIRDTTRRGVAVRRARIVSEPVSEYIRFEYDISTTNIIAGEQGRWLPRRRASAIALPGNDFWLLDGRRVQFNHFTGDGDWAGVEECDDPAVVQLCTAAFEAVWAAGIDHDAYTPA
ncbi:DUF6879 family protein [Planomonospora sp. ID91781]|uniref:DUF6879 family protein n=1 Tax=Planomonospora sp. ID91781 TaxID=2738135 RepID=UPI0027DCBFB6|nr:DUF6879 family protein [Planomonospora sp. ID91781]